MQSILLAVTQISDHSPQKFFQRGPCVSRLTLARPCSCSVRFGMWSGARRLIAACHDERVLLLDAPSRDKPLTAEDMLLNGANLVSVPQVATCGC